MRTKVRKSIHSKEAEKLQQLLCNARNDAGLTQEQLADKLGRPQSFVAKYEGGERRLDVIEFIAICRAIGIKPEKIIQKI